MFSLHSSTSLLSPLSQPFLLSLTAKCGMLPRGKENTDEVVSVLGDLDRDDDRSIKPLGGPKKLGVACRYHFDFFAALRCS